MSSEMSVQLVHSILVDLSVELGQWPFMGWRQGGRKQEE